MINIIAPTTSQRFKDLKEGDVLVVEFKREFVPLKGLLHAFVLPNQTTDPHIFKDGHVILDKKKNIYFNYKMYLNGDSIVKNVTHLFL